MLHKADDVKINGKNGCVVADSEIDDKEAQEALEPIPIPVEYLCPITLEMMENPVVAADGHSYERTAFVRWVTMGKKTSPFTGKRLEHTNFIPNQRLKTLI